MADKLVLALRPTRPRVELSLGPLCVFKTLSWALSREKDLREQGGNFTVLYDLA